MFFYESFDLLVVDFADDFLLILKKLDEKVVLIEIYLHLHLIDNLSSFS